MRVVTINRLKDVLNKKFGEEHTIDKFINRNGLHVVSFITKGNLIRLTITAPYLQDFNTDEPFITVKDLMGNYNFLIDGGTLPIERDDLFGFIYLI